MTAAKSFQTNHHPVIAATVAWKERVAHPDFGRILERLPTQRSEAQIAANNSATALLVSCIAIPKGRPAKRKLRLFPGNPLNTASDRGLRREAGWGGIKQPIKQPILFGHILRLHVC
jgi:hypothetical protein